MKTTEIERIFLVKNLPDDLARCRNMDIRVGDFFESNKPDTLKIKQKGEVYQLVKKHGTSAAKRIEHVIEIKKGEFDRLWCCTVQKHGKIRYLYRIGKHLCEIDLYQGKLLGYVRAEVEFKNRSEMRKFIVPDWFGREISQFNHEIHENLGTVTFKEMKERYRRKGIILKKILLKE